MKTETIEEPPSNVIVHPRFYYRAPEIDADKITKRKPLKYRFRVLKQHVQEIPIIPKDSRKGIVRMIHVVANLAKFEPGLLPNSNNPRSHGTACARGELAREIAETLKEEPENFFFKSRGACILANEFNYDEENGFAELEFTNGELQGTADGGTSFVVIDKVQKEVLGGKGLTEVPEEDIPQCLKDASIQLVIFVGIKDHELIAELVEGRNSSRAVKSFSLANFRKEYDFLKDILENENSPVKGNIGYDENAPERASILDVIGLINMFRPYYDKKIDGKSIAPTISYSGKSKLVDIMEDPEFHKEFENLSHLTIQIINLYEFLYTKFPSYYEKAFEGVARVGKRMGVESQKDKATKYKTIYTRKEVEYKLSHGYIYPILSGFRALVAYSKNDEKARWKTNPFEFLEKHGPELVGTLIEKIDSSGFKNPNSAAKKPGIFIDLVNKVQLLYLKDLDERNIAA